MAKFHFACGYAEKCKAYLLFSSPWLREAPITVFASMDVANQNLLDNVDCASLAMTGLTNKSLGPDTSHDLTGKKWQMTIYA
jgi:hypothetical protein